MRIGRRLLLSLVPAILGLFVATGLAYWTASGREAPPLMWLIVVAVVAALTSLGLTWRSTRSVVRRIQRLTRAGRAAVQAESRGSARVDAAERRASEYAALLASGITELQRQLDEVRLPLHILLDNRFGELNENQEEMLAAAGAAAEQADGRLRRLRTIVDLDRGAVPLRRDAVPAGDLVASLLPALNSDGEGAGVQVETDIAPALPRVVGDRARLQEACGLLLRDRIRSLPPGSHAVITAAQSGPGADGVQTVVGSKTNSTEAVRIEVTPGGTGSGGADDLLARRLIVANGGKVEDAGGHLIITLPTQRSVQK